MYKTLAKNPEEVLKETANSTKTKSLETNAVSDPKDLSNNNKTKSPIVYQTLAEIPDEEIAMKNKAVHDQAPKEGCRVVR